MLTGNLARRARDLSERREPYVSAVVVRAQKPTSVRPGDAALVLADGRIEGFVGGACAESSLRLHAARAMETGEPLLLRILPGTGDEPAAEGAVVVHNPCLSGGALEIFLEPVLPRPRIVVVGETPIAVALSDVGRGAGFEISMGVEDAVVDASDAAVVVASHGKHEEETIARAVELGVPYVGLVASRARGAAVLDSLRSEGASSDELARVHTPAGLDIGAREPGEIALSILAEIVKQRRAGEPPGPAAMPAEAVAETAVDPVCGMTVLAADETLHVDHEGQRVYFCSAGCLETFRAEQSVT
jgi:xanthine dehydrogenase accessory factor